MNWKSHGFFVIRRPLLAMQMLFDLNKINCEEEANAKLLQLFSKPLLKEALFLASPAMHTTLQAIIDGNLVSGQDKFLRALYKYFVRMSTRCTPYGMFAGITHGRFSDVTSIQFSKPEQYTPCSRLDAACLHQITEVLQEIPVIRDQMKYFPNTSIYKLSHEFRFLSHETVGGVRQYNLEAIAYSPFVSAVLVAAHQGRTRNELTLLQKLAPLGDDGAIALVDSLITMQVLTGELEPTITGPDPLDTLISKMKLWKNCETWLKPLRKIQQLLQITTSGITRYEKIQRLIQKHFLPECKNEVLQTDLYLPALECQISNQTIETLCREFRNLHFLGKRSEKASEINAFAGAFQEKYGGREVPLSEIADPDTGIQWDTLQTYFGDASELLTDITFPSGIKDEVIRDTVLLEFKEQLYHSAIIQGASSVEIQDTDIDKFRNLDPYPDHFHIIGSLLTTSPRNLDKGDFKFVYASSGGASGMELLGRFCHMNRALEADVKQTVAYQSSDDVIYAEIVHLPQPRLGNILTRPHLSDYEISFLCNSALNGDKVLRADDLMVSVRTGRRSSFDQKSIISASSLD